MSLLSTLCRLFEHYRNFILYGVIGASGALLDFIVFLVLFNILHLNPLLATTISTSFGIANNFVLNILFNFKVRDHLHHRFMLFYATGIAGLLLSVVIIFLLHDRAGINANVAKIVSIPLVVLFQYFLNSKTSLNRNFTLSRSRVSEFFRHYRLEILVLCIASVLITISTYYRRGFDEIDNLLGGQLIASGQLPYRDFFSHHMPGMYWLAALLHPFTHQNPFWFRLTFNGILLGILVINFFLLRALVNRVSACSYALIIPFAHLIGYGQMALAESYVAYIFATCLILAIFTSTRTLFSPKILTIVSLLLFSIPFFSLSYIFPAAVLYIVLVLRYVSLPVWNNWRKLMTNLLILAAPYLLTGLLLAASGQLHTFIFSIFTFNSLYYAPLIGQTGGNLVKTLARIVLNSIDQFISLGKNILHLPYVVPILLLLGFLSFCYYLWKKERKLESLLFLGLALVINPLINIFNPPAISAVLGTQTQHAIVYVNTALLFACITIPYFLYGKGVVGRIGLVVKPLAVLYLLVIPVMLVSFSTRTLTATFTTQKQENYYNAARAIPKDPNVLLLNSLLTHQDFTWIGPANFEAQLYLQPKRATSYTFFMPWQDACPSCRNQFISQLQQQKPKVIVWDNYLYKGHAYAYSPQIATFFSDNYFHVRDQRLFYYNFLISDKQELVNKLRGLGYEI